MKLLALEASANTVSIAVQNHSQRLMREMPASSKTSAWLIPTLLKLLDEAGLELSALDAILYGQGPGAFTGLRTVCSVVQGLTLGQNNQPAVYGVDTLQELAQASLNSVIEHSTHQKDTQQTNQSGPVSKSKSTRMLCVLDARMDQWYVGAYEYLENDWRVVTPPALCAPASLAAPTEWAGSNFILSSNVERSIALRLTSPLLEARLTHFVCTSPHALLCLDLAPWLIASAGARTNRQNPEFAKPIYIRDRVALTTLERELAKVSEL